MTMEYKSYVSGPIDIDPEDGTLSGTIIGLVDVIHFEGTTADELRQSFKDSIDAYLTLCAERGKEPDRPFNGKILVRTEPELHRKAVIRATAEGVSLSQWVSRQIQAAP